jgi:hypothetical protein
MSNNHVMDDTRRVTDTICSICRDMVSEHDTGFKCKRCKNKIHTDCFKHYVEFKTIHNNTNITCPVCLLIVARPSQKLSPVFDVYRLDNFALTFPNSFITWTHLIANCMFWIGIVFGMLLYTWPHQNAQLSHQNQQQNQVNQG